MRLPSSLFRLRVRLRWDPGPVLNTLRADEPLARLLAELGVPYLDTGESRSLVSEQHPSVVAAMEPLPFFLSTAQAQRCAYCRCVRHLLIRRRHSR